MLPYKPEHIADLKRRFPKALEPIVDTTAEIIVIIPGERPEHIFDCVDGIRVIASRDKMKTQGGDDAIWYHFSASAMYGTVLAAKVREGRISGDRFKRMCEERFNDLTGLDVRRADHFTATINKCFHWFWKEVYTGDELESREERNLS
jgi:hypothetical protein